MNLQEYLQQESPARFPRVVLDSSEYVVGATYTIAGEKRKQVFINHASPLVAGIEYCLIGSRFYTTDRDGNPKSMSVFCIKSL